MASPSPSPSTSPRLGDRGVVLVDHRDSYTHNLAHLIAAVTGTLPRVVQHDEVGIDDLRGHSHIVLSPGPGHPGVAADFSVGREVLRDGTRAVLGVCLGMQGLVTAFGGEVARLEPAHGEVASISHDGRGLFAGLPQGFAAVRYHSLGALRVPAEVEVSATCAGDAGEVVMAYATARCRSRASSSTPSRCSVSTASR